MPVAWFTFDAETRARFTVFQRGTLVFLGLIAFAAGFALVRSRVVAETSRLVVVNGYRKRTYEWAEVLAIHLPPGAPWAVLDLADGTSAPAMGIQGSDGGRARQRRARGAQRDCRILGVRARAKTRSGVAAASLSVAP